MCEQISTEYFQCSLCISEICLACIEWVKNSKICKIQMVCHRNHPLRENEGCEEFYKIFKKKHPDYFICDGCLHETTGKSMHCRSCKVDYCEICAKKYQWLLENEGKNTCKKKMYSGISSVISRSHHLCENKLIWMAFKSKFSCYACKKYFPKSGNFSCTGCKRTLCIVCAYQRVNRN